MYISIKGEVNSIDVWAKGGRKKRGIVSMARYINILGCWIFVEVLFSLREILNVLNIK